MKKITYLIFFLSIAFLTKAQYPNKNPSLGSDSALSSFKGAVKERLILWSFTDTSEANTQRIKDYEGALIYTTNYGLWYRANNPKRWMAVLPTQSTNGDTAYWKLNGNDFSLYSALPALGSISYHPLFFQTNNLKRIGIPADGFSSLASISSKYLGIDTATGYMGYLNGGTGSSGWDLTGNSGTTAGTNFIGTTDAVDLVFKRNSIQSGRLSSGNTSFGVSSLSTISTGNYSTAIGAESQTLSNANFNTSVGWSSLAANTSGNSNTAIGFRALIFNETGNRNTAVGHDALNGLISGTGNTGVGYDALWQTTDGFFNSSIGEASLAGNTTGDSSVGVGFRSLYLSSTGNNNIGVGSYAGAYNTTESSRIYVNSLNRTNILGDTTKSIIYGAQDAIASNQRLYLNSQVYSPYLTSQNNSADSMVVILPSTGKFGYRAIPTGGLGTDTITNAGFSMSKTILANAITLNFDSSTGFHTQNYNDLRYGSLSQQNANVAAIAQRVLYSDTASMLSKYLRKIDTTGKWQPVGSYLTIDSSIYKYDGTLIGNRTVDLSSYKLLMAGTGGAGLSLYQDLGVSILGDEANFNMNSLYVDDINNKALYDNYNHTGKFGINTNAPDSAFTLVGGMKVSGGARFTGLIQNTTLDTTTKKIVVADANGVLSKSYWPTGGSTTSTQVVATDADITAANNRLYVVPASTLSANRNIDVSGLTTNLDYIELVNYEPTYTYTFTGATVYLLDGVTTVTTITNPLTIIKRINGKLTVTN